MTAVTPAGELTRVLYRGDFETMHRPVRDLLEDDIFAPRPQLAEAELTRVAYDRLRTLTAQLPRATTLLRQPLQLMSLFDWLVSVDGGLAAIAAIHYSLCIGTLDEQGDSERIREYVRELEATRSVGLFLATELGYGNNLMALKTEAVYDATHDEFRLHTPSADAQKFMPNSGVTDIPKLGVVMARLRSDDADHGVWPFVVRISTRDGLCPGINVTALDRKPGLALDNAVTSFDSVRVPRADLLGTWDPTRAPDPAEARARFARSVGRIIPGRIVMSSSALSAARASLCIAVRYAHRRRTFAAGGGEVPIIAYRSQQRALFCALASTYAATVLNEHVKHRYAGAATGERSLLLDINVSKALCTWTAAEVVATCRERCGAQGLFSANRLSDYWSSVQGTVTAEGDSLVVLATAAKSLLVAAPRDAQPRPATTSELTAVETAIELFAYRERALRAEIGRDLAARRERGEHRFQAWNANINAALDMARAYGVRLALQQLRDARDQISDPVAREAFGLVASLFAACEVERVCGWLLAVGVIGAGPARELPSRIDTLCEQIQPHALLLVDAFEMPNRLLRAPIGGDYLAAYDCRGAGDRTIADVPRSPAVPEPEPIVLTHPAASAA